MINTHPGLPEFDYVKPASLDEASRFLADNAGEARPFAGGTDCFVRMRDGFMQPKFMVDVKGLEGTQAIQFDPKSGLSIGAGVPMNQVIVHPAVKEYYPILAEAASTVASYQLRSRATIVGNICNASPAGDTIGACIVLGGVLNIYGLNGYRTEPLANFFLGPGRTQLKPGDIVVSLHLPVPPANFAAKFIKLGRNKLGDLSIVAVTTLGYRDPQTASGYSFLISLTSVAPIPLVATAAMDVLAKNVINDETIAQAAQAAMDQCTPIDDVRGSARYRKYMVRNLVRQTVTTVWNQIKA
jgi:aerobic carbon-monoxide dehydrogenase medium subunit